MRFRPHPTVIRAQYNELRQTAGFKRWRRRQYLRQWSLCCYCLRPTPWTVMHCDHVRAVAVGGGNGYSNFMLACGPCNMEKSAQVLTRPYELWVRLRLLPLAALYELWAFLVLLVTGLYTVPER